MRRFLSYLVLLSVLTMSLHGFVHLHSQILADQHNCTVCEVQSHTAGIEPATVIVEFVQPVEIGFSTFSGSIEIEPISGFNELPRGPPSAI